MFSPSASTRCVLWLLLTSVRSACFLKQSYGVTPRSVQISPGKNAIFLSIYLLHLLPFVFDSRDFDLYGSLIQRTLALYEVRSSDQRFAADFLQIPSHDGHPCLKLMVTTAFTIRDSHPRDSAHAGRTRKEELLHSKLFRYRLPLICFTR
jgi:hypothetical protein